MRDSLSLALIAFIIFTVPLPIHHAASGENKHIGAFFYPSYGHYRSWNTSSHNPPVTWASHYLPDFKPVGFSPSSQLYDSMSEETIRWQLSLMKKAMLDFIIASWWGPRSFEDQTPQRTFKIAGEEDLGVSPSVKWCILYEKEGQSNPSFDEIVNDLKYVKEVFGKSDVYFRLDERLVVFVMADPQDNMEYAEKWREVRRVISGFYTVLKVFPGFVRIKEYSDSWFQYAPANRFECHEGFSAYASPGFWRYDEGPRLERDPSEFARALTRLHYAPAQFLLIETWNNWLEGSQIEPAYQVVSREDSYVQASTSYNTTYIDLVRIILREEANLAVRPSITHIVAGTVSSISAGILIAVSIVKIVRGRE